MRDRKSKTVQHLLCGAAALALTAFAGAANAEETAFNIQAQPLATALMAFGNQSGYAVMAPTGLMDAKTTRGVTRSAEPEVALAQLLDGTGLTFTRTGDTFAIVQGGSAPQDASAAGGGATVEALIVTAQKREEDIQDVPIAISAFSEKQLQAQKIEGGFDLVKAIPNVTFSKTNFTSYNFSIRGVGTKAISATTDPGVAVSFNNTPIIQNRLFEQEYFDVQRVEVLRGPQGTLFGRNATSGVINVISAKPDMNDFDGWIKGEVGNYHTKRSSAMVNIPIVEDKLAIRLAGSFTDRQGYDYNTITKNAVNGRDLWSARLTIGFEPTEKFRGNFIWERFNEDDNRSRTGKQLCHRDDGPDVIGNTVLADGATSELKRVRRMALFGQGCKPGSLYDEDAFGTPNGFSISFISAIIDIRQIYSGVGVDSDGNSQTVIQERDPYAGLAQSPNLREIASFRDPKYRADADLLELNLDYDLTPSLTLTSQTAYVKDETYSFQDYNRFNTQPIFTDTSGLTVQERTPGNPTGGGPSLFVDLAPGGIFCDPQLGCSNTIAGFDIAQAKATQFNQELRLQSSFDGPVNFSVGANYTRFKTEIDYYVMYNLLTAIAMVGPLNFKANALADPPMCVSSHFLLDTFGPADPVPLDAPNSVCPYIDPNPVESINGEGHNYFRSRNPYKLESWAGFGEVYWNIRDDLKLTAGLRYTDDEKTFIPVPTQVLLSPMILAGGTVPKGYPEDPAIIQNWGEWTGRIGLDWQPELDFTDQTLLYAFYSRGYKGGGANPPSPGFATEDDYDDFIERGLITEQQLAFVKTLNILPVLELTAVEYGKTFEPEFVNAFEIGTKNTLLDGAMIFNATAFYYDYKDYQVSQIRDRTAVNENFDATMWGLEFETVFSPSRDLQIIANLGYLDTKIADGETSIDIMNRTQSDPNYQLTRPWMQLPSNCVVPTHVAEAYLQQQQNTTEFWTMCGGIKGFLAPIPGNGIDPVIDPMTGQIYDVSNYPELNGGAGILADLGGNELPNAPHWTMNIGVQYGRDILDGWRVTLRGDAYWQSQSWHRVYNLDPYDKLHGWYNANLSLWVENPDTGLKFELYAKNILDDTPITDAFLNSDDTALTTNVFVLDPRLIGLSIYKEF